MCFSSSASFSAAGALTFIGGYLLYSCRNNKEYLLLAAIPFIFGIQQFTEGMVWVNIMSNPEIAKIFAYIFTFFAYPFWPIFFPLSLYFLEKNTNRKRIILVNIILSSIASLWVVYLILSMGIDYQLNLNSITYFIKDYKSFYLYYAVIYFILAVFSLFVVSTARVKFLFLAFISTISFISSILFYEYAFTSVWCFFMAWISIYILIILKDDLLIKTSLR